MFGPFFPNPTGLLWCCLQLLNSLDRFRLSVTSSWFLDLVRESDRPSIRRKSEECRGFAQQCLQQLRTGSLLQTRCCAYKAWLATLSLTRFAGKKYGNHGGVAKPSCQEGTLILERIISFFVYIMRNTHNSL